MAQRLQMLGDGVEMKNMQEHNFEELDNQGDDLEINENSNKKKNSGSKLLEKE